MAESAGPRDDVTSPKITVGGFVMELSLPSLSWESVTGVERRNEMIVERSCHYWQPGVCNQHKLSTLVNILPPELQILWQYFSARRPVHIRGHWSSLEIQQATRLQLVI